MGEKMKVLIITSNLTFSSVKCWSRGQKFIPRRVRAGGKKGREIHYASLRKTLQKFSYHGFMGRTN